MVHQTSAKPYRLVALGRLAASTRDQMGDTLGSLSGMALEPGSWQAKGRCFAGTFVTVGDRGFNIPEQDRFSNYATRMHRIAFEINGARLSLSPLTTTFVRDERGALTTGLDARGSTKQFGVRLPSPEKGAAKDRLAIDSEGIAIASDGRVFISDEYGPSVYCCAADGSMVGVIVPPDAFVPRRDGTPCFSRDVQPDCGRSANDGFEGLSLRPTARNSTCFCRIRWCRIERERNPRSATRASWSMTSDAGACRATRRRTMSWNCRCTAKRSTGR